MPLQLLLLSNSTNPGEAYLHWPQALLSDFIDRTKAHHWLFVPYAGVSISYDDYTEKVATACRSFGITLTPIHQLKHAAEEISTFDGIMVGGGNTFHLLYQLQTLNLLHPIREMVLQGKPFIGWSAGSNIAGPSIKTTNDMPVIEPLSFNSLNLVPFQINPHYTELTITGHGGETRQQRIEEFLHLNPDTMVVGLREATALRILDQKLNLLGSRDMMVFKQGEQAVSYSAGSELDFLMH